MKTLLLYFVVILCSLSCSGMEKEIFLPRGTPLFETTEISGSPQAFIPQDMLVTVQEVDISNFKLGALNKNTRILKIIYPETQKSYWTFSDIKLNIDPVSQKVTFDFLPYLLPMTSGILCLAAAAFLLLFYLRGKESYLHNYLPFGIIIMLQYGLVLYIVGATGNIMMIAIDDLHYYEIARKIAHLDFSGQWHYTIGLPLFYVPVISFFGGNSFNDARVPLYVFNSLFAMPLLLCMAYLVIKKISSARSALLVILIWFVMILLYHHRYYYIGSEMALDSYLMKSFPRLPSLTFSYSYFELLVLLGYNAVSDTLSCALVFFCIAASLYMKASYRNLALFSALFALACLVRINNIFFAPLLAFCLYLRYVDILKNLRQWLRFLLIGAVSFCIVFSVQLAVNAVQLGHPLTFPYVLHPYQNVTKGFLFNMLPFGIRFLGINNFAYFVVGTLALFFIADRRIRILLSLWTLPLVLFFFGYPVVFTNGTRFILPVFAGFIAAIVLADIWKGSLFQKVRCAVVLLAGIFLTAPAGSKQMDNYLPWAWERYGMSISTAKWIQIAVIAVSFVLLCSFFYDLLKSKEYSERRQFFKVILFLSGFLLLFYWANPYAIAVLMFCALLRAIYDIIIIIIQQKNKITGSNMTVTERK